MGEKIAVIISFAVIMSVILDNCSFYNFNN